MQKQRENRYALKKGVWDSRANDYELKVHTRYFCLSTTPLLSLIRSSLILVER